MIDELRAKDKKNLFYSSDAFANYSTGYLPLDYANAFRLKVKDGDEIKTVTVIGVIGGTFITIVGGSGTGKSTLAMQIGANIIKPFENGLLMYGDCELTAIKQRLCELAGMSEDDPRIVLNKDAIAIEDHLEIIDKICEEKELGGDKYKYEVHDRLFNGKTVKLYQPTVIIVDSLWTFNSKDMKTGELEGDMSSNRATKQVGQFYNKCLHKMNKYNIIIIAINHIKSAIQIDPYHPVQKQLVLLNPGESLPKGSAPIYLAHTLIRLNQYPKSSMYTKEDNGFSGYKVKVQYAKTKTAFIGSEVDLTFNPPIGFDPIYSLYEFASSCGLIEGRNPYLYIKGAEVFKFNRKKFNEIFINDEEFREMFMKAIMPYLEAMIGTNEISDEDRAKMQALSMEYIGVTDGDVEVSADMLQLEENLNKKKKK